MELLAPRRIWRGGLYHSTPRRRQSDMNSGGLVCGGGDDEVVEKSGGKVVEMVVPSRPTRLEGTRLSSGHRLGRQNVAPVCVS